MNTKLIVLALIGVPLVAVAANSNECPPSNDRIITTCIIVPESDDTFIFKFHAEAKGNGHGKPKIFTKIDLDNKECLEFRSVAWENGKGGASAICTKPLKKGKGYTLKAVTGNENAESISAVLTASRAGNEN